MSMLQKINQEVLLMESNTLHMIMQDLEAHHYQVSRQGLMLMSDPWLILGEQLKHIFHDKGNHISYMLSSFMCLLMCPNQSIPTSSWGRIIQFKLTIF